MIHNFLRPSGGGYFEATEVDTDANTVKIYTVAADLGFPFGPASTYTPEEMGYQDMRHFLRVFKRRNKKILREVPHDREHAAEITGLLRLAKSRHERGIHYADIPPRLCGYCGLTAEYADKITRHFVIYGLERHTVKVSMPDGDEITTEINGSVKEIEQYYTGMDAESVEFLA